jgi:hypothetical protein
MLVDFSGKYLKGLELRRAGSAVEKLVELLAVRRMPGGKDLSASSVGQVFGFVRL